MKKTLEQMEWRYKVLREEEIAFWRTPGLVMPAKDVAELEELRKILHKEDPIYE